MHQLGFPAPVLQKKYTLRNGSEAFVDFWFKELNLAGAFDGKGKYLPADFGDGLSMTDRLWREKQREDSIWPQGVRFVRWTCQEVNNRTLLERLLRQAGLRQITTWRQSSAATPLRGPAPHTWGRSAPGRVARYREPKEPQWQRTGEQRRPVQYPGPEQKAVSLRRRA